MVWFQCEDCGDNLKKPKLPNHFRACRASKLSCIDCGEVFGRQTVEGHTQCITEAEKYGPRDGSKAINGTKPKTNNGSSQKPDVDINVGLSSWPPWFCSLCNTKATSQQTLLLHAEGKKHKAKARAFHAGKQPQKQPEETNNESTEKIEKNGVSQDGQEEKIPSKPETANVIPVAENGDQKSSKKRKLEAAEKDGAKKEAGEDTPTELGNGEVIQVGKADKKRKSEETKKAKNGTDEDLKAKDSSSGKEDKKKIKWKKLITSALKSNPDGSLKYKKLAKVVLKSLKESGYTEDEGQFTNELEQKVNSSSKFTVDGKYIRLANKS